MNDNLERIAQIGIVPVVKINAEKDILPMANALKRGGIDCMEITFRSEFAEIAIQTIKKEHPDMLIGAGTVTTIDQAQRAQDAGATFVVSPGLNPEVVTWCLNHKLPIIPGVQTGSEIETAMALGLTTLKFFPAGSSGGAQKLKDYSGPYQTINFIPTGGINLNNMNDYLNLPNVLAIGGSFMLPNDAIENGDWDTVETLSRNAIKQLLQYRLIHIGIHASSRDDAKKQATLLAELFHFNVYDKPKGTFAGEGFEILNEPGRGEHGHIAVYASNIERALYQLQKKGIHPISETITRNKKTQKINFVYLDLEILGFAFHLINPDINMS